MSAGRLSAKSCWLSIHKLIKKRKLKKTPSTLWNMTEAQLWYRVALLHLLQVIKAFTAQGERAPSWSLQEDNIPQLSFNGTRNGWEANMFCLKWLTKCLVLIQKCLWKVCLLCSREVFMSYLELQKGTWIEWLPQRHVQKGYKYIRPCLFACFIANVVCF